MQKQNTQTSLMSNSKNSPSPAPRTCLCSSTNHPGSFRCRLHRGGSKRCGGGGGGGGKLSTTTAQFNRLQEYSSRLGFLKAFLMQIIKPSSHDQQRRRNFQPKPTRFCVMMKNKNNGTSNSGGNQVAVS